MASNTLEPYVEHKLTIQDDQGERLDRVQRGQWLRAAILGSNDGLLSTTSLMLGMAAAKEDKWAMMLAGIAAAIAGACSMAVGEYVSVATQRDIEEISDIRRNPGSFFPEQEKFKLQLIPSPVTKVQVSCIPASPTMTISAEAPNELPENAASMTPRRSSIASSPGKSPIMQGVSPRRTPLMKVISEETRQMVTDDRYEALPSPLKAGGASAVSFLCGAIIPLLSAMFINDHKIRIVALILVSSIALAMFGGIGAHLGGSPVRISAMRVLVGGWIAMGISYGLLKPFDKKTKEEQGEDTG
ncbi:Vacuolar iron transporter family protein [Thalictrum thalictroides]|uniref:Vacuolar iron transporter n=1 Tax=Thalictrum thalictroides TaxID=46969 RepID=A0A7J6W093_THATH|nr:Vacuolar iron transporter family protein [Thalictrum thalictroides]